MVSIDFRGRVVYPITSDDYQKGYYDHLNYWRVFYDNTNQLIIPTQEDASEYIKLQAERDKFYFCDDK